MLDSQERCEKKQDVVLSLWHHDLLHFPTRACGYDLSRSHQPEMAVIGRTSSPELNFDEKYISKFTHI
jgi:hypothetical protein